MSKSSDVSLNYSFKKKKKKTRHKDKCLLEPVWLPRANALPSRVEKPVSICLVVFPLLPVSKEALGSESTRREPVHTTEHWGLHSVSAASVLKGTITSTNQSSRLHTSSSIYFYPYWKLTSSIKELANFLS